MSNIRDSDLLLVNRGDTSYKCTKANIGNVRDTDLFLVNRGSVSYYCSKANIGNIRDSDTVLVNRSNVSYRATGADLKGIFGASSPGTSGQDIDWCADIVSTNDIQGVRDCSQIFEPIATQNFSRGGRVNATFYIQFDLPFDLPWTNGNNSRFTVDICDSTDLNVYASTNVTGRGNFEFVRNQTIVSPGKVTVTQTASPLSGASEVYAVRYESNNVSQGVKLNNFGTTEHGNWRVGATGGNSYANNVMQIKDTDKYIYLTISGLDTSTLNPGDTLTVAGTSATGKVYKVIDSSTVLMSLNSTDPWPAGPITVS